MRKAILLVCLVLPAFAAQAGAAVPELDPGSLGAGIGLATAVIALLADRRPRRSGGIAERGSSARDETTDPR